jgi:hypothetical protein
LIADFNFNDSCDIGQSIFICGDAHA